MITTYFSSEGPLRRTSGAIHWGYKPNHTKVLQKWDIAKENMDNNQASGMVTTTRYRQLSTHCSFSGLWCKVSLMLYTWKTKISNLPRATKFKQLSVPNKEMQECSRSLGMSKPTIRCYRQNVSHWGDHTFTVQFLSTRRLEDFKSRWITGGLQLWR